MLAAETGVNSSRAIWEDLGWLSVCPDHSRGDSGEGMGPALVTVFGGTSVTAGSFEERSAEGGCGGAASGDSCIPVIETSGWTAGAGTLWLLELRRSSLVFEDAGLGRAEGAGSF